jgi:hypothetical protein
MKKQSVDVQALFLRASENLEKSLETARKQYVSHSLSIGEAAEKAFRSFLGEGLPRAFAIGKGFVFEPGGKRGLQQDVVIYDNLHHPILTVVGEQGLFPIDTVAAVIEVKATLGDKEIKDAVKKIASIKSLKRTVRNEIPGIGRGDIIPLWGYIFAYETRFNDAQVVAERFADATGKNPPELRPDDMFILGKWWFDWVDKNHNNIKPSDKPAALRVVHVGQFGILQLWTRLMGYHLTWYRTPTPLDWVAIPDWGATQFRSDYLEFREKT